jgi:DNA-binding transcriptional MerR regulator
MAKRDGTHQRTHRGDYPAAPSPAIPDKLYFRIGEVAALCRVPTYVLRFWQTEFPQLHPGKSGTGQRLYRRRDVEMALRIKCLLHEEGYTIAGAKGVLAGEAAVPANLRLQPNEPFLAPELPPPQDNGGEQASAQLQHVRDELRELLALLQGKPAPHRGATSPDLHRETPQIPK